MSSSSSSIPSLLAALHQQQQQQQQPHCANSSFDDRLLISLPLALKSSGDRNLLIRLPLLAPSHAVDDDADAGNPHGDVREEEMDRSRQQEVAEQVEWIARSIFRVPARRIVCDDRMSSSSFRRAMFGSSDAIATTALMGSVTAAGGGLRGGEYGGAEGRTMRSRSGSARRDDVGGAGSLGMERRRSATRTSPLSTPSLGASTPTLLQQQQKQQKVSTPFAFGEAGAADDSSAGEDLYSPSSSPPLSFSSASPPAFSPAGGNSFFRSSSAVDRRRTSSSAVNTPSRRLSNSRSIEGSPPGATVVAGSGSRNRPLLKPIHTSSTVASAGSASLTIVPNSRRASISSFQSHSTRQARSLSSASSFLLAPHDVSRASASPAISAVAASTAGGGSSSQKHIRTSPTTIRHPRSSSSFLSYTSTPPTVLSASPVEATEDELLRYPRTLAQVLILERMERLRPSVQAAIVEMLSERRVRVKLKSASRISGNVHERWKGEVEDAEEEEVVLLPDGFLIVGLVCRSKAAQIGGKTDGGWGDISRYLLDRFAISHSLSQSFFGSSSGSLSPRDPPPPPSPSAAARLPQQLLSATALTASQLARVHFSPAAETLLGDLFSAIRLSERATIDGRMVGARARREMEAMVRVWCILSRGDIAAGGVGVHSTGDTTHGAALSEDTTRAQMMQDEQDSKREVRIEVGAADLLAVLRGAVEHRLKLRDTASKGEGVAEMGDEVAAALRRIVALV